MATLTLPATDKHAPIGFARAAAYVTPSRGATRSARQTLLRWARQGVKAADGTRVKLAARKQGGHWTTTVADLEAFIEATTRRSGGDPAAERSPAERHRATEAANRELERLGL